MTNNFKILNDYNLKNNINKEIIKEIEEIESLIKDSKYKFAFIEGRKVLELILSNYSKYSSSLDDLISKIINDLPVPTRVKNSLYSIKTLSNESSHAETKTGEIPFVLEQDIFSAIEFTKHLFLVIKYFIMENNKLSDKEVAEYQFNTETYLNSNNKKEEEVEDLTINSVVSQTRSICSLILSENNFLIPTYQRSYSWKEEQVNVFLQDVKDRTCDKQPHYLGSLAISHDVEKNIYRLIDGQQRITTSLLLIKSIIKRYLSSPNLKMPDELNKISKKLEDKYINKTGSFGDIHYVKRILRGNDSANETQFTNSNAYKNFTTISNFINGLKNSQFDEFYTTFASNIVVSELKFKNELTNEILIFENLNSKGLELAPWDLIKNYIYKNIDIDLLLNKEAEIEKYLTRELKSKTSEYFGHEKSEIELNNFFSFYNRIKYKEINSTVLQDKGKVQKIFSQIWPMDKSAKFDDLTDLESNLEPIARYLEIYCIMKSKKYTDINSPFFDFKLPLTNIDVKDAHLPLVMQALYFNIEWEHTKIKNVKNSLELYNLFTTIEKFIIRLLVVNNIGQSLSLFFDNAIQVDICFDKKIIQNMMMYLEERIKNTTSNSYLISTYKEFATTLEEKNNWPNTYAISVLRRVESHLNGESHDNKRFEVLKSSYLERIFPQKPEHDSSWFIESGIKTKISFDNKADTKINMLGNFVLLTQSINSKLSNKPFLEKKEIYIEKDKNSVLLSGSNNETTPLMNILSKNSWTFDDIDTRTKELAKIAGPLYKFSWE